MAFKDFFLGKPGNFEQVQKYQPQQIEILNQLASMGLGGLQNPGQGFAPIAQKARSDFLTQTAPGLAERFTSLGQNRLGSGAFQSQLLNQGRQLEESLASLGAQFGQQEQQNLLKMLGLGLTPQFESVYRPQQEGFLQQFAGPALQSLGSMAPIGLAALAGRGQDMPGGGTTNWLSNFTKLLGAVGGI